MTKRTTLLVALLFLPPILAATAPAQDYLYLVGNREVADVDVRKADVKEVIYKKANKNERLAAWEVEFIQYGDTPASFVLAYEAFLSDAQNSPELFRKCLDDRRELRKYRWLEYTASYYEGVAFGNFRSRRKEAIEKLQGFVDNPKFQDNIYYPQALRRLVNLYWGSGTTKERALEIAQRIVAEAEADKVPLKWKFDALLFLIRREKDAAVMRAKLDELTKDKDIDRLPDVKYGIKNTLAGLDVTDGNWEAAMKRFAEIVAAPDASATVLAEAFYGLGISRYTLWEQQAEGAAKIAAGGETWRPLLHAYVVYKDILEEAQIQEVLFKAARVFRAQGAPADLERVDKLVTLIKSFQESSEWKTNADKLLPVGGPEKKEGK